MTLPGILTFELGYQLRRPWPWLMAAVLVWLSYLMTRDTMLADALYEDFFVNSPFAVARTAVVVGMLWLVAAAGITGEAAARDVATGMHPLTYTTPVSRASYLGGRFLAAFLIHALLLAGIQVGILLAVYAVPANPETVGPFRGATFLTTYAYLSLPNAFAVTAVQFWMATRSGRPVSAYVASFLLFFLAIFIASILMYRLEWGLLLDPTGMRFIIEDLAHQWTPTEKKYRLLALEGLVLRNRLVWVGVGVGMLGATWATFRFRHRVANRPRWLRWRRRAVVADPAAARSGPGGAPGAASAPGGQVPVPAVERSFGWPMAARHTLALARTSFGAVAGSRVGVVTLVVLPLLAVVVVLDAMTPGGFHLIPRTAMVLPELTAPLSDELSRWLVIPLLIAFFAGELVWREREAGLGEITDASPVGSAPPVLGKVLGLTLWLALLMALLGVAGAAAQLILGYAEIDVGLYATALLGLQLPEYLLFAALAMAVHLWVDQKYVGHLLSMGLFVFIAIPTLFHVERELWVYGAGPDWSYTEMAGFAGTVGPWLRYRLYWAGWGALLLTAGWLLKVRGSERGPAARLRLARRRLTPGSVAMGVAAAAAILTLGGWIFWDTSVRRPYYGSSGTEALQAEYERLYGRFADDPQPRLTGTHLEVELYPDRTLMEIRGAYDLVNDGDAPIDSIHVAVVPGADNGPITFDRAATAVIQDEVRGHRTYALAEPLAPGESTRLGFQVRVAGHRPRGVVPNGTLFTNTDWLPSLGYQTGRELMVPSARREHGLPQRAVVPPLDDEAARIAPAVRTSFEATLGTAGDQVAVAPGSLRRTWTDGGRRYFHYETNAPLGGEYAIASARYATRDARWKDVDIRVYHHPEHADNVDRLLDGAIAALTFYDRTYGPYPFGHLTIMEAPGNGVGMHADGSMVRYSEGSAVFERAEDGPGRDLPYEIMAHELAHQWWGHEVTPAVVEGIGVMAEGLAVYSSLGVIEATRGRDALQRTLAYMRLPFPYRPMRRGQPLLRGIDPYVSYRRAPFALHALGEEIGADRVRGALRQLVEKHPSGGVPRATTRDLVAELRAVTPDSVQPLLHDLFEVNTFWDFRLDVARAVPLDGDRWQVTLELRAEKVEADTAGVETERPVEEWVQVGVFAAPEPARGRLSAPLYLERHRLESGRQTLTVTVTGTPALAGVDPFHVLDWEQREEDDNIERVRVDSGSG